MEYKSLDVKKIIINYLKENGYDGLCYTDEICGCGIDDLMPCGMIESKCRPAYKHSPAPCDDCGACCDVSADTHEKSYCYRIEKPNPNQELKHNEGDLLEALKMVRRHGIIEKDGYENVLLYINNAINKVEEE